MPSPKPKSRIDQVAAKAQEAHEMAVDAVVKTQAHTLIIGGILGVLKDFAVINPEAIKNVFLGVAKLIDSYPPTDEATTQTIEASREFVAEMAGGFGIEIPKKGQVVFSRIN
jgi:hypothetical protein